MEKKENNIYKNKQLILTVFLAESYRTIPYVFKLYTNLVFSEKDFLLLCKRLERRRYKNMSHVLEQARKVITEKNKKIKKEEFFEMTLDDTILSKKSYTFGKLSRNIKSSYIEKEIDSPSYVYDQFVIKIKEEFKVLNLKLFVPKDIISEEVLFFETLGKLVEKKYRSLQDFAEIIYKKLNINGKIIEIEVDNKYKEKHTYVFSLKSKKVLRKKVYYSINRGNYSIELLYMPRKKELSSYILGRTSKRSIEQMIKKINPIAYEIRINGGAYPINIETVKTKNKNILK